MANAPAIEFAGFRRRLVAFIADAAIIVAIAMALSSLFPFAENITVRTIVGIAYHVGFLAWRGQTPGKILLNIKVIRTDGGLVSLGYALLRFLGYVLSFVVIGIGFLQIIYDPRKQGWHDKIADTYVIKLPTAQREVIPAA